MLSAVGIDLDEIASRFWPKVKIQRGSEAECWLWLAYTQDGYGRFAVGGRMIEAHRVSVLLVTGSFPPTGTHVDHLCRNHPCVNPKHLEVVTPRENARRGVAGKVNGARQRAITHCPQGHAYDATNTGHHRNGARRCRKCDAERAACRRAASR